MSSFQTWLAIALSFLSIILIPLLIVLIKVVQKATRLEVTQEQISRSLMAIVQDKDKVHATIFSEMKDDRHATDTRLRWLEEYVWKNKPL